MNFPYKGRNNIGKKRGKQLFSTLWDEAAVIVLAIWIIAIIWEINQ